MSFKILIIALLLGGCTSAPEQAVSCIFGGALIEFVPVEVTSIKEGRITFKTGHGKVVEVVNTSCVIGPKVSESEVEEVQPQSIGGY